MTSSPGRSRPPRARRGIAEGRPRPARARGVATLAWVLAVIFAGGAGAQVPDGSPRGGPADEIRLRLEQFGEAGSLRVAGIDVAGEELLALYEPRDFQPLWTPGTARALVDFVQGMELDGLEPARYGAPVLDSLVGVWPREPGAAAGVDLVFSDALLQVTHDLRRGVVDPSALGPEWADTPRESPMPPDSVAALVSGGDLRRRLAALRPGHFIYQGLVGALARYRTLERLGGWPMVGEGPLLALDSISPRVPPLRVRLLRTGDLAPGGDSTSTRFDADLDAAVRRFQHRHGLNDDGVVGPSTRAALDVPVEERIRQLRLNLERARWVTPGLGPEYVAVNIAGQRTYLVRDDVVVWESRVVVGGPFTRTPVFRDTLRYLVVNPTWTVPRSINGEILARLRREPGYLRSQGFDVLDASGARVDPATIDFGAWTGASFPWVFRQRPGPANALGRIKFMFPNPHNIYLHDSPARQLFAREERLFSHGCIRVQDPLRLAELLLEGQGGPDRGGLTALIATGETRTLPLEHPLPVLLLYWTAATDLHGEVHFYPDVYQRDTALARALADR